MKKLTTKADSTGGKERNRPYGLFSTNLIHLSQPRYAIPINNYSPHLSFSLFLSFIYFWFYFWFYCQFYTYTDKMTGSTELIASTIIQLVCFALLIVLWIKTKSHSSLSKRLEQKMHGKRHQDMNLSLKASYVNR